MIELRDDDIRVISSAIIMQAVEDLRKAKRKRDAKMLIELYDFFTSKWGDMLIECADTPFSNAYDLYIFVMGGN